MIELTFSRVDKPDSLVEIAANRISAAILDGRLQPGDQLVEDRLASQLGVSRIPIREAFQQLEGLGLVEKVPHRGAFVSQLREKDVTEMHVLRVALETLAVRTLAQIPSNEVVRELRECTSAMRAAAEADDRSTLTALDAGFHDALISLTGNKLLEDVWHPVSLRMRRFLTLKRHHAYATIRDLVPPHELIVSCIEMGDVEAKFLGFMDREAKDVLSTIHSEKAISEETEKKLKTAIEKFVSTAS